MDTKEVKIEIPEGYEIDESKSSFKKIVFKKKEKKLPKSWKEYAFNYPKSIDKNELVYSIITSDFEEAYNRITFDRCEAENWIPSKYGEAFIALTKLIILRDVYNDGWKPDWCANSGLKQCIYYSNKEIKLDTRFSYSCILAFKTEELRDEFYNNFKDLIEQAKELL